MQITNDGASRKASFTCLRIDGTHDEIANAKMIVTAEAGVRYIDVSVYADGTARLTFEVATYGEMKLRNKLAPKVRKLVLASSAAADMGEGFDGFGKVFTLRAGDACVYGLSPDFEGSQVRYAYFAA